MDINTLIANTMIITTFALVTTTVIAIGALLIDYKLK